MFRFGKKVCNNVVCAAWSFGFAMSGFAVGMAGLYLVALMGQSLDD